MPTDSDILERFKKEDYRDQKDKELYEKQLKEIDWDDFYSSMKSGVSFKDAKNSAGGKNIRNGRFRNLMFDKVGTRHENGFVKCYEKIIKE